MLRIITGSFRGHKLEVPPSKITRPTTDRVRESIFNLLESTLVRNDLSFNEMIVLDAFAGSGALGFEALSRGAKHITFFEQNPAALKILQHNAAHLKLNTKQAKIQRVDATKPTKTSTPADLVFMDPPYGKGLLKPTYEALIKSGWCGDKTIMIIETSDQEELPAIFLDKIETQRTYGSTTVTLLKRMETHNG